MDEIIFYSEKSRKFFVTQFVDLPENVREAVEAGEKLKMAGFDDYKQMHVNDEPLEYDVNNVGVAGLGYEEDELRIGDGEVDDDGEMIKYELIANGTTFDLRRDVWKKARPTATPPVIAGYDSQTIITIVYK